MPSPTIYPFRQVLSLILKQLAQAAAVPAINADLLALMSAENVPALSIPQFSASSVLIGDKSPVSGPTICVMDGGDTNQRMATEGLFCLTLITQFQIKTPRAGDNAPEDFSLLGSVCTDTLRDLLTSEANQVLIPKNPAGQNLLPAGMAFQDCVYLGSRPLNFPHREADKVTYTRGWVVSHSASICYFQNRPGALGT